MKYLSPNAVNNMEDSEEVYVNRIAINSRIIQLGMLENRDYAAITVLIEARKSIFIREKGKRVAVWGAKMKIKDIRRVFVDIEKMPSSSFKSCGY